MEKDNLGEQLMHIISKTDQRNHNYGDRERVWANINRRRPYKKAWYYATAVAIILIVSLGLLFPVNKKPAIHLSEINKRTIEPNPKTNLPVKEERLLISKKVSISDTIEPIPVKMPTTQVVADLQITAAILPSENIPSVKSTSAYEDPVIVEFKRGAFIEEMKQTIAQTAIPKKISLKQDTMSFPNTIEKQIVKLSFRRQN
ncbi:MAG: hypothetical protein V4541_04330 [Bacteroidota bacterium]